MESLYWVFTRRCNDFCRHCYNESGPGGDSVTVGDAALIVGNLPQTIGRLILSGGEPLVEMDLLRAICALVGERYGPDQGLHIQTNGVLLTPSVLRELETMGVSRIDVTAMDDHHALKGAGRDRLRGIFEAAGWRADSGDLPSEVRDVYAFWGATDDLWLRGSWPRGRALQNGVARLDPEHNFCALWSGAVGFLQDGEPFQEVAIQLHQVFPCCPGTWFDIGDARRQPVADMLEGLRGRPEFEALNRGHPADLPVPGESRSFAEQRMRSLGSCCLWCDEFFREYYRGPHGERRPYR